MSSVHNLNYSDCVLITSNILSPVLMLLDREDAVKVKFSDV